MDLIFECAEAPTIMASVLNTLTINHERAKELCQKGFITATDLMEALAHEFSLPLRQAKMIIERAVKYSESHDTETVSWEGLRKALKELDLNLDISSDFVKEQQEPEKVVRRRKSIGGPAPEVLLKAVDTLNSHIQDVKVWLAEKENQLQSSYKRLEDLEKGLLNPTP
jgi:argininosuccinate lyase